MIRKWPWWNIINSFVAVAALMLGCYQLYKHELLQSSASLRIELIKSERVRGDYRSIAIVNDGVASAKNVTIEWADGTSEPQSHWKHIVQEFGYTSTIETILPNSRYVFYQTSFKPDGFGTVSLKINWTDTIEKSVTQTLPR